MFTREKSETSKYINYEANEENDFAFATLKSTSRFSLI